MAHIVQIVNVEGDFITIHFVSESCAFPVAAIALHSNGFANDGVAIVARVIHLHTDVVSTVGKI